MLTIDSFTNRIMNSQTYILSREGSDVVWLIDCGDTDRILERVGEKRIEGVLLTHAHSDHIYGLTSLLEKFPELLIYTNDEGVMELKSPQYNLSFYHSEYPNISIDRPKNVKTVKEGEMITLLGFQVSIFETPGHDPSCLTYLVDNMVFTGDAYIPGVKVFTGFPHSNRIKAQASVERILQLSRCRLVMPGHRYVG